MEAEIRAPVTLPARPKNRPWSEKSEAELEAERQRQLRELARYLESTAALNNDGSPWPQL